MSEALGLRRIGNFKKQNFTPYKKRRSAKRRKELLDEVEQVLTILQSTPLAVASHCVVITPHCMAGTKRAVRALPLHFTVPASDRSQTFSYCSLASILLSDPFLHVSFLFCSFVSLPAVWEKLQKCATVSTKMSREGWLASGPDRLAVLQAQAKVLGYLGEVEFWVGREEVSLLCASKFCAPLCALRKRVVWKHSREPRKKSPKTIQSTGTLDFYWCLASWRERPWQGTSALGKSERRDDNTKTPSEKGTSVFYNGQGDFDKRRGYPFALQPQHLSALQTFYLRGKHSQPIRPSETSRHQMSSRRPCLSRYSAISQHEDNVNRSKETSYVAELAGSSHLHRRICV